MAIRKGIRAVISGKAKGKAKPANVRLKKDREAELAEAISGKGSKDAFDVLRLSDEQATGTVHGVISTRSVAVDRVTGIGGFPRGRIVEVFGQPGVGKTTLLDQVFAEAQARGGTAALYEPEHKKDKNYSVQLGVDVAKLLSIEPRESAGTKKDRNFSGAHTIEAGVEAQRRALEFWISKGYRDVPLVLGWDSIAGSPTEEEIGNPQTEQPGVPARALRRAMRQLAGPVSMSRALLVLLNQQYAKIGGFSPTPGVKRSTYGGDGPRYGATLRLELIRIGTLKDARDNPVGIECLCKVEKNHLSVPGASLMPVPEARFAVAWGRGIVNAWSFLEKLREARYITAQGGVYTYQVSGGPPAQWQGGWQGLDELLRQHADLQAEMTRIYNTL